MVHEVECWESWTPTTMCTIIGMSIMRGWANKFRGLLASYM